MIQSQNDLAPQLQSLLKSNPMWAPVGSRIGIAVSGGRDSVTLVDLLSRLQSKWNWTLYILHFNHQLRGKESDQDQEFVENLGMQFKIPVICGNPENAVSTENLQGKQNPNTQRQNHFSGSMEMRARSQRHTFLADQANRLQLDRTALAHHQDDQQELFWIRLLRGASLQGLSGMHALSKSPIDSNVSLLRPLLTFSRHELSLHLQFRELEFREDSSNQKLEPLRNRIRWKLIPWVECAIQPGIRSIVDRWMKQAREVHEDLEIWLADCQRSGREFRNWPRSVQKLHIARQLPQFGRKPEDKIIEWLRSHPEKQMEIRPNAYVRMDQHGTLQWADNQQSNCKTRSDSKRELSHEDPAPEIVINLNSPGSIETNPGVFRWETDNLEKQLTSEEIKEIKPDHEEWFDADKVGLTVQIRRFRPGDIYHPIGARRPVHMQKYLAGLGCNNEERRNVIVAVGADNQIFWSSKGRIGELFKLDKNARRRLKWSFTRRS